ncbi:hypothetical protein [Edaphobacter sp. 12200R-103]|jgi:hypothetical protein|nr:hypothetical protein [Edaphobacter sp. 12200R-103]QHS53210.1 hypothetical protein GWR55_16925 [Edaphobacter sp. 12200R-103]
MRLMKNPILISLVLFAAVAYAPASHLVAYDATSCNVCPSDVAAGIQ